jgi:hypothetical protein
MIEDSAEEFYTASSGERSFDLPVSRRHDTGDLPALIATTPWPEDTPTTQAMWMVPPQALTPWSDTNLPLKQRHAFQEGQ